MPFADRAEAGRRLAQALEHLRGSDVVVVGLPRGGVPVAYQVAKTLRAPLDIIVVRKLGVPFQPELAMGAIGENGARIVNEEIVRSAGVSARELAAVEAAERAALDQRIRRFRGGRAPVCLRGRTVVVVDDGIATGSTAKAACQVVRGQGAARVVLAVPVAPPESIDDLRGYADEVVCLEVPEWFFAVGQSYARFAQTTDDEVVELLRRASLGHPPPAPEPAHAARSGDTSDRPLCNDELEVQAGPVALSGNLVVPAAPRGIVIFAHGSGSSRHSPRNRLVAAALQRAGLGTLLFDLLTPEEEYDRRNVFDILLLGRRLLDVTAWVRSDPMIGSLAVGYFGASTGAAAALWAAGDPEAEVSAIVSRGGRPDLARDRLPLVTAPTLLVVGGADEVVLELNREALGRLHCDKRLEVVPGATHLFEEPGALEAVAALAADWFTERLAVIRT